MVNVGRDGYAECGSGEGRIVILFLYSLGMLTRDIVGWDMRRKI
jgi:hypothetical protein